MSRISSRVCVCVSVEVGGGFDDDADGDDGDVDMVNGLWEARVPDFVNASDFLSDEFLFWEEGIVSLSPR